MTNTTSARRRLIQVGLIAPLLVTVVGVVIQLIALPRLPDPAAVHWGVTGEPDGFGPGWTLPVLTAAVGLILPLLVVGAAVVQSRTDPRWAGRGASYRFTVAAVNVSTVFTVVLLTASVLIQVGVADAANGPTLGWSLLAAFVIAVLAGVAAWAALPPGSLPAEAAPIDPASSVTADVTANETWIHTATMSRVAVVILAASVVLVLGLGIGLLLADPRGAVGAWITIGAGLVVALLAGSNVVFHVTVDASGLTVRSALGLPRFRVPIADVASVAVVEVNPMAEFGGWGMRWAPSGRFGVVLRTGEGIEVTRTNGKTFTVTVDDAAAGAALLQAYRDHAHQKV